MNAIEYIYLYSTNKFQAERLRAKADAIESALDAVTTFTGDAIKVQSSPDPLRREKLLAELADTTRALNEEAGRLELTGLEVLGVVSRIDPPEYSRCLMYCGVMGLSDREIEQQTGEKHLSAYWLDAIQELQKYLDDNGIDIQI